MKKSFERRCSGAGFTLGTWVCDHRHERPGAEQHTDRPTINVVVSGMFVRHVGRAAVVADPTVAVVATRGDTWRSSHPPGSVGDRGVWVLLDEDLGPRSADRVRPLAPADWLGWLTAARHADAELATALVAEVIDGSALPSREPWYVARARRVLAGRLGSPPDLAALAEELRVSPWHLCRTFRAVTGLTPRAYAERLRLVEAARRVSEGRPDLAALAVELGFTSHSHLTARYRAAFGVPPSGHWPARS